MGNKIKFPLGSYKMSPTDPNHFCASKFDTFITKLITKAHELNCFGAF